MPYFSARLKERNGEQEYSYDHIIQAPSLKEAEKFYEMYAKTFYDDEKPSKGDDGWYFFGGAIWAGVDWVRRTTKAAWLKEQFNINLKKAVRT